MRGFNRWTAIRAVLAVAVCALSGIPVVAQAAGAGAQVNAGKKIAFTSSRGNCLACHVIPGGEAPGNIGPPLIAMKSRFSSREKLRQVLWNPESVYPGSSMPPFGKNRILSQQEIEQVVDFIWSL